MKLSNLSVDEILAIVEPMMDNCLAGSNENDHGNMCGISPKECKVLLRQRSFLGIIPAPEVISPESL